MSHLIFIVGPTASGKSQLAIDVAQKLDAVIINADASQLYRGMDIGTAKVPVDERGGIPHLLIDVLDVTEEASVAQYQEQARALIDEHLGKDQSVVVVGGSGLYIKAVIDPLEFPGTDTAIRDRLIAEANEFGAEAMYARLQEKDPVAAVAILPGNTRRVIRALEVIEMTGQPFTATLPRDGQAHYPQAKQYGIAVPTGELEKRITQRTEKMWADGLIDEVRHLETLGLRQGRTASTALGYAQALAQLDGLLSEEGAIAATTGATKKFAKRQRTWFKRDERIKWLELPTPEVILADLDAPKSQDR